MFTQETDTKMRAAAPAILRVGLSLVILWFGYVQVAHTADWIGMVPDYAVKLLPLPPEALVLGNGIFELVFGFALLLGVYTRLVAGILTLHLAHILTVVGYNPIGVRDFGLMLAMLSVFLYGKSSWRLGK